LEAVVLRQLGADCSKLNAAGREDMDVRMLGGGRPFILEVQHPIHHAP
jgi:tRNA pseudouridine synthase 10